MILEHTLHGYDDGHRLLASSIRLAPDEDRRIGLLSDLSGYLPANTDYDLFYTGYPAGRFYAFACTFPDREGKRKGTVFTHTLLLSPEQCALIHDLQSIVPFFRRPTHPVNRDDFRRSLRDIEIQSVATPGLSPSSKRILAAHYLGLDIKPLLFRDPEMAFPAVRALWSFLPPWLRRRFTFCTFTIQPRYLGADLFDFMAIAPNAEGYFYSIRDRSLSIDAEHPSQSPRAPMEAPWLSPILGLSSEALHTLWQQSIALGFPELSLPQLKLFLRYTEFKTRSEHNPTAALSRIDLLRHLVPANGMAQREKDEAIRAWLKQVRAIAPEQRSLILLLDILERHPKPFAPSPAPEIEAFIRETLAFCAPKAPKEQVDRLVKLAEERGFEQALIEAVGQGIQTQREASSIEEASLAFEPIVRAMLLHKPQTVQPIADVLPSQDLWSFKETVYGGIGREQRRQIVAAQLKDVHQDPKLFRVVPVQDALEWLQSQPREHQSSERIRQLAETLPAPSGFQTEKFLPLWHTPMGARILVAYASQHAYWETEYTLRRVPGIAKLVLEILKHEPEWPGADNLAWRAAQQSRSAEVLMIFGAEGENAWERALWFAKVVEGVGLAFIEGWIRGDMDERTLKRWLLFPSVQQMLRRRSLYDLERVLIQARGEPMRRALRFLSEPNCGMVRAQRDLLKHCLESYARSSMPELRAAAQDWARLLSVVEGRETKADLCSLSLGIALKDGDPAFAPLVEAAFGAAHRELLKDGQYDGLVLARLASWLGELLKGSAEDWDRARKLRRQLARIWVERDWPPLTLLKAANGDERLFEGLADEVLYLHGGKKALRRMVDAASRNGGAERWSQMIRALPKSVRDGN